MKCFKIDEKSYYVEFKNSVCKITEFGNKDDYYVFTLGELKELIVDVGNASTFSDKGIIKQLIDSCSISNLTEEGVCIKLQLRQGRAADTSFIQVPLEAFCRDITIAFKANQGKDTAIDCKMPSIKEAFEKWKSKSSYLFLEGQFLLVNHLDENVGIGYFDDKGDILALSKTNLEPFEALKLYYLDGNYANVSLKMKKRVNNTAVYYKVKLESLPPFKTPEKLKPSVKSALQALETVNLQNAEEAEMVFKKLDIKEIGRAKSVLDDFINL